MKYQIIVVTCSEERKKNMIQQLKDLDIKAPVYFLQGFTPLTNIDYIYHLMKVYIINELYAVTVHIYLL